MSNATELLRLAGGSCGKRGLQRRPQERPARQLLSRTVDLRHGHRPVGSFKHPPDHRQHRWSNRRRRSRFAWRDCRPPDQLGMSCSEPRMLKYCSGLESAPLSSIRCSYYNDVAAIGHLPESGRPGRKYRSYEPSSGSARVRAFSRPSPRRTQTLNGFKMGGSFRLDYVNRVIALGAVGGRFSRSSRRLGSRSSWGRRWPCTAFEGLVGGEIWSSAMTLGSLVVGRPGRRW